MKLAWDRRKLVRAMTVILIVLCAVFIVHDIFGEHGLLALRRERKQVEALQQQIQQLQQENLKLEEQIKALKSDPKAIEKLAREQMRLARPGEIIYTLPEKSAKRDASAAPKVSQPK